MAIEEQHSVPTGRHLLKAVPGRARPRIYRLAPSPGQQSAYRRLALALLGLDVVTLADELRSARGSAPPADLPLPQTA
jgi:hypothetical protein